MAGSLQAQATTVGMIGGHGLLGGFRAWPDGLVIKRVALCNSRAVRRGPKVAPMNIFKLGTGANVGVRAVRSATRGFATRTALADWLTVHEVAALDEAVARGCLPQDLVAKLRGLAGGDLSQRFIEQNCQLFAALLLAADEGSFRDLEPAERERLLRVLAYVRKDEDAIPDRFVGGFADDQREILAATIELGRLLQAFKAWRLRHQVPVMWADQTRFNDAAGVNQQLASRELNRARAA